MSYGSPKGGLRVHLVALFVLVFGTSFALFSIAIYFHVNRIYKKEFDAALYNYVVDFTHSLPEDVFSDRDFSKSFPDRSELMLPFSTHDILLQLTSVSGGKVLSSANLQNRKLPPPNFSLQDLHPLPSQIFQEFWISPYRYRMVTYKVEKSGVGPILVQAAVPMVLLERQREGLIVFLVLSVPFVITVAASLGYVFSRRAMKPVGDIIQKANQIEAMKLSERIPVPRAHDEIRRLVLTLNGLLNRLEQAFKSQEAFIADASHQLKTPLSILKGELEVFRSQPRSPDELSEFLQSAHQEIDYLSQIVEDLLILASADQGDLTSSSQTFRIDEKLLESLSRLSRVAEKKRVQFNFDLLQSDDLSNSFEMEGDPELIRSLLENLVENALKYSPSDTTVHLTLEENEKGFTIHVIDEGPGIPKDALPHLFDRFYRAESTRNQHSGSGLGLSIVKRITDLHRGQVSAENSPEKGAHFWVFLPRRQKEVS